MVFSDTSSKLGVIQACERYCGLGDAGVSGNATLLKEFTAHANEASRVVWSWIFMSYGGWQYDDGNQTNLPAASDTLTASQTAYALPATALTVRGVEVKTTGNVWEALIPITEEAIREQQALGEFMKTPGQPLYYQLVGSTIRLYPPANYTQASSFKVFFDRGSVAFASTDTSVTPGFVSEFHGIIPVMASLEWLSINKPDSSTTKMLFGKQNDYQARLMKFYNTQWRNMQQKMRVGDSVLDYV